MIDGGEHELRVGNDIGDIFSLIAVIGEVAPALASDKKFLAGFFVMFDYYDLVIVIRGPASSH